MTVTWQHEAVSSTCGGRTPTGASSSWTGQWPQPLSHRVLPADCRTCPTLRNLFPTYPSSFSPISPFFSVPPSINFNFSNGSTTTSSSPHSLRRSTPPATSEAEARGASTFHHGGLFGVYSQLASPPSLAAALVHFRRHDSTIVLLRENGGS